MLEDSFELPGHQRANLTLMLLSMLEFKLSAATKSVDAILMTLPTQMEVILDPPMEALDLALLTSMFLPILPMVNGLFNGPGLEELLLLEITTLA